VTPSIHTMNRGYSHLKSSNFAHAGSRQLRTLVDAADRWLNVIGCVWRTWLDQLRPDRLPVIRAKHLARNKPVGRRLDRSTMFNRDSPTGLHPLMNGALRNTEDFRQCAIASHAGSGGLDRVFAHVEGR
jgi:hypothetical protein